MEKLQEGYISKLPETCTPFGVTPLVRCLLAKGEEVFKEEADEYAICVVYAGETEDVRSLSIWDSLWACNRSAINTFWVLRRNCLGG